MDWPPRPMGTEVPSQGLSDAMVKAFKSKSKKQ